MAKKRKSLSLREFLIITTKLDNKPVTNEDLATAISDYNERYNYKYIIKEDCKYNYRYKNDENNLEHF